MKRRSACLHRIDWQFLKAVERNMSFIGSLHFNAQFPTAKLRTKANFVILPERENIDSGKRNVAIVGGFLA
jgi:hypothetical protein